MRLKGLFAGQSIWIKGLIILILCFINLCLGALIARGVSFLLTNIGTGLDSITDELIEQAIVSAVAFILTGWVCIKLLIKNDNITKVGRTSLKEVILPAIFLILFSIPFINQLAVWNSELTLPESLAGLEKLMKEMEDTANAITMQFLERTTTTDYVINIIVLALIPAIGEEMLFRGTIQQSMTESGWNKHLSVILTAAIFSAIHFQFYGFLPRLALGIILGYAFLWSGSVWISSLIHFINNALVVTAAFAISKTGLAKTTEEGMKEVDNFGTGDYITPAISLLLVVMLMLIIKRYYARTKAERSL